MNFTKEYIELCKNPKVQGLRPENPYGSWYDTDNGKLSGVISCCTDKNIYKNWIWLPTSDQLDEIILNICRKKFNDNFQYEIGFITSKWYGTIRYWKEYEEYMKDNELMRYATEINEDPLICKLRLLITLLRKNNV